MTDSPDPKPVPTRLRPDVERARRQTLRELVLRAPQGNSDTKRTLRLRLLARLALAIDEVLPALQDGQGIFLVFDLKVVNSDYTFLDEEAARRSPEARYWRAQVLKRDQRTCQECGEKKHLQAHHISDWATDPLRRFDVDNGVTLCADCHGKKHPRQEVLIKSNARARGNQDGAPA